MGKRWNRQDREGAIICAANGTSQFDLAQQLAKSRFAMAKTSSHEVTQLLIDWSNGSQAALDRLMPLVDRELHRLAHHYMRRENPAP